MYGLPKLHKPGIPLHPIVSFIDQIIDSPTYNLSKHLVSLLSPLTGGSPSHVWNSTDFARFIAGQYLSEGEVLVLYDVISLFTNVLVDLACRLACERLFLDPIS